MHTILLVTVLQYANCYVLRVSLAHHQGAHNCTKHLLNVFCR